MHYVIQEVYVGCARLMNLEKKSEFNQIFKSTHMLKLSLHTWCAVFKRINHFSLFHLLKIFVCCLLYFHIIYDLLSDHH